MLRPFQTHVWVSLWGTNYSKFPFFHECLNYCSFPEDYSLYMKEIITLIFFIDRNARIFRSHSWKQHCDNQQPNFSGNSPRASHFPSTYLSQLWWVQNHIHYRQHSIIQTSLSVSVNDFYCLRSLCTHRVFWLDPPLHPLLSSFFPDARTPISSFETSCALFI